MRTIVSRLINSRSSVSRLSAITASGNGRYLSTDSNKVDEPLKVEEAETVNVPPPPSEKVQAAVNLLVCVLDGYFVCFLALTDLCNLIQLLVLGGNGFVGSHICREALDRGLTVASLSRYWTQSMVVDPLKALILAFIIVVSGRSSLRDSWANNVIWHQGNLLSSDSWKEALDGVTAVISCVGGFGSNSYMYKINGTANINAIRAASEKGVKRFVYISAADFGVANYLLQGYYEGKRAAETELLTRYPYGGVILRPGFIYGTRTVGGMKLPLGVIGSPMEMVLQHAKPLSQLPLVGPLFTPPVNVTVVAKVAVRAATDPVFPPGIVDVHGILRYSQKSR
ncbi:NAD(P)-bd dom domain-containing protein [Citrus sinensis]|uniref:NAD(P)-bd dom domain-containing protein n=1 Tax=Citrus sinensis TaxID=2711 RepID=A0ACB8NMN8_CITSI|nr:NAD(P)-bd dom domain-containing protein [Citrus sinensis]KAH9798640.1 NAD(P)-bd dom domain-containing protein [Citrus sinensis]